MTNEQFEILITTLKNIEQKLDYIESGTTYISSLDSGLDDISKNIKYIAELMED